MTVRSLLHNEYEYRIYPKIQQLRGAHALKRTLQTLCLVKVPKIDREPVSIFDKEWDALLILDACRHDVFEEVVGGQVDDRITLASRSAGFIEENFSEGDYSDVIVITANPHFSNRLFRELTGRRVQDVFHTVYHTYTTDWDEE
jgi:Cys-tRNA synthase (O-phospho-L-seryl-tRNA:Cys-tRNA synthase)